MKTKTKAKTKPTMKWTAAAPSASPFEPDGSVYQVRHISLQKTDGPSIRAALDEVMTEALRLAPANLDASKSDVMFEWDPVYATLTVTFTDGQNDARDVLKLFFKTWDREQRKAPLGWESDVLMSDRRNRVLFLLETRARQVKPELKKLFPNRRIRLRFREHSSRKERSLVH